MIYFILVAYLSLTFLSSLRGFTRRANTPESYFLADRKVGNIVLFFTLVATTFSAFYFLGFAGEGYRIGYSHYAMIAFGTAFAALSFYIIGHKAWGLGKTSGYITPVELIGGITGSPVLKNSYLVVMVLFTFPYVAIQPIGAGYILSVLTNGQIPYFWGAAALTGFIILYVFLGGMRSVANTDVKQGILMFILMGLATWAISRQLGGLGAAHEEVYKIRPDLFTRQGADGFYTPKKWFSLVLLWIGCLPMLPQIFMRFFIAKDLNTLKRSTFFYSIVPAIVFLFPVVIGVLGHLSFPELQGKEADQILPKMLVAHTPEWMAALVMTGALAAFMSTLDSQLLALSTIATRDVYVKYIEKGASLRRQVAVGKIFVILFALVGLLIAYRPFDSLFSIVQIGFTGLAILFPVTVCIFYLKKVNVIACIAAVLVGEFVLFGLYLEVIPSSFLLGFEPVIPLMVLSGSIAFLGSVIPRTGR